jgi:uncharacterized protein YndB with AHSA1/START domain
MSRSIEREIRVQASPEVVYEVVSSPEHLREWWPDDAEIDAVPGATGTVTFAKGAKVVPLTVVEADPPRRFSFRWAYDAGDVPTAENSLLVTFDLVGSGDGTLLRFVESGYDEAGKPDEMYHDHVNGWDYFLPRLTPYVDRLVSMP